MTGQRLRGTRPEAGRTTSGVARRPPTAGRPWTRGRTRGAAHMAERRAISRGVLGAIAVDMGASVVEDAVVMGESEVEDAVVMGESVVVMEVALGGGFVWMC